MNEASKTLRLAADILLDLFAEYYTLAEHYRQKGDTEQFKYWSNRTMDISKEYHRIKNDIEKVDSL